MSGDLVQMIKAGFAQAKDKSGDGINSLTDACSHYRSKAGGQVKANPQLYEEMKNSSSFKNKFIPEMIKILKDKIIKADVGTLIKSAPGSNRPLSCTTMGMYKLNIEYCHKVTVGVNYVELHLFGSDKWDFETSKDKGFFKNLTQEIIPGLIAGKGKPFDITYDFKYTVQIVPEYFFIQSSVNPAYLLDILGGSHDNGANVQVYSFNLTDSQKFSFSKCGDYVYIVAKVSGKVLDVKNGGKESGTNVQQYEYNGTFSQQWKIVNVENNLKKFVSRVNGLCLDLSGGNASNGGNIQCWESNDTNSQKFLIKPVGVLNLKVWNDVNLLIFI